MKRLPIFVVSTLLFSLLFDQAVGGNCEAKTKITRALRQLPASSKLPEEGKHLKPLHGGNPLHAGRATPVKRKGRESIPQLARNIESFLQKVIPNHNLVQDLMGYITMPNPNSRKNFH